MLSAVAGAGLEALPALFAVATRGWSYAATVAFLDFAVRQRFPGFPLLAQAVSG